MTDYYDLPARPPKEKRDRLWLLLLLFLLLFLLALAATAWSLRLKPGELAQDPLLSTTSLRAESTAPVQALAQVPTAAPEPEPEPVVEAEVPASEPEPAAEPAPEPPPPLFSDVRWRETARFTGTDTAGRSAEFTAYVLVGDETWTYARADAIFASGLSEPVETAFDKLELGAGICALSRVISVGAASVEGTSAQNTFLSHARGHALKFAITENLPCEPGAVPTSVLDLGYNRQDVVCPEGEAPCPDVSAPQRPIAMILTAAEDPETDIGEALRNGIAAHEGAGSSVFPGVKVSDYSAFDLR
ncbi:MAG: hypothetical protein FP825_12705 [Hyphomonas sp.]|uniref:hypothetical protein n=1 Tax=Hyphomonas sp. TaxID=87 RepID=UPI0017C45CBF|nr:hypothetical protein [Hyphomonas sp.]MBU3922099.1 hypothetical protein [Alphaproteobacteria bacterium]MBA3069323.1 hypothetical protein [Hyphomonas sp.]MBU4063705.1 hypothetical protein [Alphaproteobacteria bacterium]MBU4164334.1 hypothetical protein [Alphaproteobacteria bacterium]MBU4567974.1 hypothetical protein [Alphaproteobacteria bacterium]